MRPLSFALAFAVLAVPPSHPLAAQTGSESNLILTLFGGAVGGHALWAVDRQPLCVLSGSGPSFGSCDNTSQYDTLRLTRSVSASIMAGVSATYFRSPHVGLQAEFAFLGLPFDDSCANVAPYVPDADAKNQQVCENITAAAHSTSAISLFAGVIVRASPTHALSPYLRAGAGFVSYYGGTLELSGAFQQGANLYTRSVIVDEKPKSTQGSFLLGAGFTSRLSPGYQFRFEFRDAVVPLSRVVGPADLLGRAPSASHTYHHLGLTLGLDVVLERKRGRRY